MNATRKQAPPPLPRAAAGGEDAETAQSDVLPRKIAALNSLTAQELRDEWRRLHRMLPPRLSRDLLIRTAAFRMQELAYGGLSKTTIRSLATLTKELAETGAIAIARDIRLRPGTRLVREWRGRTHMVAVTTDGFEYAGQSYSSLTTIAQVITGAHWSGPRFFGLNHSDPGDSVSPKRGLGASRGHEDGPHE